MQRWKQLQRQWEPVLPVGGLGGRRDDLARALVTGPATAAEHAPPPTQLPTQAVPAAPLQAARGRRAEPDSSHGRRRSR